MVLLSKDIHDPEKGLLITDELSWSRKQANLNNGQSNIKQNRSNVACNHHKFL